MPVVFGLLFETWADLGMRAHSVKIFSVVWIGCRSTFVLCTALLTGRLSLLDVLELAIASY